MLGLFIASGLAFKLIHYVHSKKIKASKVYERTGLEISLNLAKTILESGTVGDFGPGILSAKILRGFFILFALFIILAYQSMLRSALVSKDLDGTIDSMEVIKNL